MNYTPQGVVVVVVVVVVPHIVVATVVAVALNAEIMSSTRSIIVFLFVAK